MNSLNNYIFEKLHLDKNININDDDPEETFADYIMFASGIRNTDNSNIDLKAIKNILKELIYLKKIKRNRDFKLICNSKFDLLNRHKQTGIMGNYPFYYDSKILSSINYDANNLMLSAYPFKIYNVKEGILIVYQRFNDNYKILVDTRV